MNEQKKRYALEKYKNAFFFSKADLPEKIKARLLFHIFSKSYPLNFQAEKRREKKLNKILLKALIGD